MSEITTLLELLEYRARQQPHDRAYVFLSDRGEETGSLTFSELDRRARALAQKVADHARAGDRALLLFLPGLDFIIAFFACMAAGAIPVPMMVPRRTGSRDESANIVGDCSPRVALTNHELLSSPRGKAVQALSKSLTLLTNDDCGHAASEPRNFLHAKPSDIAFLQYTSGSTSSPKGVMVSHHNLIANLKMMADALITSRKSTFVSWLPLYHDMGLIFAALNALYAGAMCVLMAPVAFIQRPMTWLNAIHAYRAEVAGAPNFGFDLCVDRLNREQTKGLDLSSWRIAFNAAEPVRNDTIERFASAFAPFGFDARAMYPCYGMAEAALTISGRQGGGGPVRRSVSRRALQQSRIETPAATDDCSVLIGCGTRFPGEEIAVVDPECRIRLGANCIGEVWASGPNICQGYWQNVGATAASFQALIEGEDQRHWLRTGDLGFTDERGELFITGRLKDLIIVRGMNHYPQDIETTVQDAHPALRRNGGAAFAIEDERGREAVAVVHEIERTYRHRIDVVDIIGRIRDAVFDRHELALDDVALTAPGALPRTTSGKTQRSLTRQLWLRGELDRLS